MERNTTKKDTTRCGFLVYAKQIQRNFKLKTHHKIIRYTTQIFDERFCVTIHSQQQEYTLSASFDVSGIEGTTLHKPHVIHTLYPFQKITSSIATASPFSLKSFGENDIILLSRLCLYHFSILPSFGSSNDINHLSQATTFLSPRMVPVPSLSSLSSSSSNGKKFLPRGSWPTTGTTTSSRMTWCWFLFIAVVTILPTTVHGQCIHDLHELRKMEQQVTDTSKTRTYIICPNKEYDIGSLDYDNNLRVGRPGDDVVYPPLPLRPNLILKCGTNGLRTDQCWINSGHLQIDGTSMMGITNPTVNNVLIQGFTFIGATKHSLWVTKPGSITFRDCEWKVRDWLCPVLVVFCCRLDHTRNSHLAYTWLVRNTNTKLRRSILVLLFFRIVIG